MRRDSLEDLDLDGKLILNLILQLQNCGSKENEAFYIKYKEGRVTGLSTSGVGNEFCITLLKICDRKDGKTRN
jgi:hypothetical protein